MLLRLLGASNGSDDPDKGLSVSDGRRKNGTVEAAWVGGTTIERRCKEVAPERLPSEGGEETKLGDVVRVSDLRPGGLEGVGVGAGVGSSALVNDRSLSGLSESGRRLRPAGRGRARVGVGDVAVSALAADEVGGDEGTSGSSSSSSSSTRVWS